MTNSNFINLNKPEQNDLLQEVLREDARELLAAAIEDEVAAFIAQHHALETDDNKRSWSGTVICLSVRFKQGSAIWR